jgi:hypothetical protein
VAAQVPETARFSQSKLSLFNPLTRSRPHSGSAGCGRWRQYCGPFALHPEEGRPTVLRTWLEEEVLTPTMALSGGLTTVAKKRGFIAELIHQQELAEKHRQQASAQLYRAQQRALRLAE